MNKGQVSNWLRKMKLLYLADWVHFYIEKTRNKKKNVAFKEKHPGISLPPDYLLYESFMLSYDEYYYGGLSTAQWLAESFSRHTTLKDKKILDWGCGPGRTIRHLPAIIGNGCTYDGTDYNQRSIEWCASRLAGISFNKNPLEAKLPYQDNCFDIIYGISIFTHLSEQLHYDWYNELYRVLNKGGIMLLTTQGNNFTSKLTAAELEQFNSNQLVVRGNVKEGHRTFSAFHPEGFMQHLFHNAEILEHIVTKPVNEKDLSQDTWIIRKS